MWVLLGHQKGGSERRGGAPCDGFKDFVAALVDDVGQGLVVTRGVVQELLELVEDLPHRPRVQMGVGSHVELRCVLPQQLVCLTQRGRGDNSYQARKREELE